MVRITFIAHDGTEHAIEVDPGLTLMEAAINHAVPGIDAECGGACMCATCHVYVEEPWSESLPDRTADEESMLACAVGVADTSRLGCQILLAEGHDGLVVRLPASQH
jgi:ferredoxin, 2Fe-2S